MKILYLITWEPKHTDHPTPGAFPNEEIVANKHFLITPFFPQEQLYVEAIGPGNRVRSPVLSLIRQGWRAWLRQKEFDLILGVGLRPSAVFLFFRWLFRTHHPTVVLYDYKAFGHGPTHPLAVAAIKQLLSSVAGILYAARATEHYYFSAFPEYKKKFHYFTIGSPTDAFAPLPRSELNPANEVLVYGHDSRDYATLFRAWEKIEKQFPKTRLRIIGTHPQFPLPPRTIAEPAISQGELNRRIQNSLCVIFPLPEHIWAAGSTSILNTLAQGAATIISDVSFIREYLCDDQAEAYLRIPPADPDALADALSRLLEHPDEREQIKSNARAYVQTYFPLNRTAKHEVEIILSCLDHSPYGTLAPDFAQPSETAAQGTHSTGGDVW